MYNSLSNSEEDRNAVEKWSKKEEEVRLQEAMEEERNPSRKPLHVFFIGVSVVATLAAVNMALGQIVGIVFQQVGPIQYVMRIYVIILCALTIFNELEWTIFTRDSKILQIWPTRGLFYAFIGVLGLEENDNSKYQYSGSEQRAFNISLNYIKAVAWIMVACGALYFFMGIFCLHLYYNRLRQDYQDRCERAKRLRSQNYSTPSETV